MTLWPGGVCFLVCKEASGRLKMCVHRGGGEVAIAKKTGPARYGRIQVARMRMAKTDGITSCRNRR